MNPTIKTLYFSATGTTRKIVSGLAESLAEGLGSSVGETNDFTMPDARNKPVAFSEQDLVIVGIPVYAGRVPNVLVKYLNTIQGNGASAIAVVVYGNRNYDDALIELKDILESDGFRIFAGATFIGEHAFSKILGANRPDERDMAIVREYALRIAKKWNDGKERGSVNIPGNQSYATYMKPKSDTGKPFHKITPKTGSECVDCKLCVSLCPMGSIDYDDVTKMKGICIKCCACIKGCPVGARYFDDPTYLEHAKELEDQFTNPRKEPELFL